MAVREWYKRQSTLLDQEVDTIRDNSLQELFALRRSLELAALRNCEADTEHYRIWIGQIESLHLFLNDLIDGLVPPFVKDSLPLAIATYLRKIKSGEENFEFSIQHSAEWDPEDHLHVSKAILVLFQELEEYIGVSDGISSIDLAFTQEQHEKQICVKLKSLNQISVNLREKIRELCRAVLYLSDIKYRTLSEGKHLSLEFRWLSAKKE